MSRDHRVVDEDCPRCDEGPRVRMDHEIVCEWCHGIFGGREVDSPSDKARRRQIALYTEREERDTYHKSGKYRMFGGFVDAYEGNGEYELGELGEDTLLSIR